MNTHRVRAEKREVKFLYGMCGMCVPAVFILLERRVVEDNLARAHSTMISFDTCGDKLYFLRLSGSEPNACTLKMLERIKLLSA